MGLRTGSRALLTWVLLTWVLLTWALLTWALLTWAVAIPEMEDKAS